MRKRQAKSEICNMPIEELKEQARLFMLAWRLTKESESEHSTSISGMVADWMLGEEKMSKASYEWHKICDRLEEDEPLMKYAPETYLLEQAKKEGKDERRRTAGVD